MPCPAGRIARRAAGKSPPAAHKPIEPAPANSAAGKVCGWPRKQKRHSLHAFDARMDSPSSPPPPRRVPFVVPLVLAVVAATYAWFLVQRGASYAGGSDSSGYLNSARLLAHGKVSEPVRTIPGLSPPVWNNYF